MRIHLLTLGLVIAAICGCNRDSNVVSVEDTVEPEATIPETKTGSIYSVAVFDPKRDVNVDLADTIAKAKVDNKRIILEVGGQW